MHEHKTLWDTKLFRFSQEEAVIAPIFRDWMSHSGSKLGEYLAEIQYASEFVEFSKADVRDLETRIVRSSGRKVDALPPLRLLGKIVYRINHTLQLSIPQPALAVHLTPPKNPFAFDDVNIAHRSVKAWLESEKSWLEDLCNGARQQNVPFELLLLSAALHSGVLNQDLAMGLHTAILKPDKHIRYSDRLYVDLSLAWLGKPDQEVRRWYPDDGVACLFARLTAPASNSPAQANLAYPDLRRQFCDEIHARLKEELRRRNVEDALLPKDLADLFKRIALFLRSETSAVMVRFATRELTTHSLLPPSIDQVYGHPAVHGIEVSDSGEEESADTEDEKGYGGDDTKDVEPTWMQAIRASFSCKTTKRLQEDFDNLESKSIVGQRIISFARSLLKRGPSSGKKLKPSSAKCCVLTVARRLGPLLEERDPATINGERIEDLYVRVIYDAAKDSEHPYQLQGTVAWALREFHCFLVRERLAKPLNEADVFRIPRGFPSVDAMIVSADDIYKALHYLDYEPNPSWSGKNREIAKMEILLGFFAGLRTMEGLGAIRRHFPGGEFLPFLVLPSNERDLKTPNAARMIPIATFMEPFDDLVKYASKWAHSVLKSDGTDGDCLLFENASDDVIIPMVGEALRAVTGNERVRYYSLRHSFASWTLTRLLICDLSEIQDMFPHLPKTTEWLRRSNSFRRALYGNAQVSNNHAWALATLMGHSTPKVSFASYCHTLDILLPEFLRDSGGLESVLSNRDRLRLSSFRRRSASYDHLPGEQKLSDNGASDAALEEPLGANVGPIAASKSNKCRIEERNFALGEVRFRFPNLQSKRMQMPPACHRSWLEQTWGLLYMRTQPNLDFEKLAEFLGVEIELAQRILTRNDEICWLRSVTAGQDLHATITIPEERNGIKTVRYPRHPDSNAMKTAHQLVDLIAQFVNKDSGKAARILEFWSRNVVPESGSVVFTMYSPEDGKPLPESVRKESVREYCRFLRWLGVLQRGLCFVGACGTKDEVAPTSWYTQWGLTRRESCKIINQYGKRAERVAPGEWLSIGPQRACPRHEEYDSSYRNGFRFAMQLASIRFGASPCCQ
jgi:hypothetical protein